MTEEYKPWHCRQSLSLEKAKSLWQISTNCIYSETHQIQFLNTLENVKSLQRIIFNDLECQYV